jgi:dTDP-4-amino-4,6-dideoxygalactose transaminase
MNRIDMLNLRAEFDLFAEDVRSAVNAVLDSQAFIGGPAVGELEQALAGRIGTGHAVAISSGTDALLCALMALEIGPGDEVIVSTFTFFATAGVVVRLGARPVFVDIDPRTFNMDPAGVRAAITARTRAIMPVHVFGQCAEMDAINALAAERDIPVVEDAAQAIGATYRGRPAGAMSAMACVSFYPTKNLGGFGEGGMIFSDDERLATVVRRLRNHGQGDQYHHDRVGGNFRLDTMKAAILLVKLPYLDRFTAARQANAAIYDQLLEDTPVVAPHRSADCEHVFHQYSILTDRRDELRTFLADRAIGSGVYYPVPLHLQPCFADLGHRRGAFPIVERTCERVMSLPCHPMLTRGDVTRVAASIHEFFGTQMPEPASKVASDACGTR